MPSKEVNCEMDCSITLSKNVQHFYLQELLSSAMDLTLNMATAALFLPVLPNVALEESSNFMTIGSNTTLHRMDFAALNKFSLFLPVLDNIPHHHSYTATVPPVLSLCVSLQQVDLVLENVTTVAQRMVTSNINSIKCRERLLTVCTV